MIDHGIDCTHATAIAKGNCPGVAIENNILRIVVNQPETQVVVYTGLKVTNQCTAVKPE